MSIALSGRLIGKAVSLHRDWSYPTMAQPRFSAASNTGFSPGSAKMASPGKKSPTMCPFEAAARIGQLHRIEHVGGATWTFSEGASLDEFLKPVHSAAAGRTARSFRAIGSTSSRQ